VKWAQREKPIPTERTAQLEQGCTVVNKVYKHYNLTSYHTLKVSQ